MDSERWLTIHYLDGTSETYIFPKQAVDDYDLMNKINSVMSTDRLILEADEHLHMIPLSAVKRFEFSPVPDKLPQGVIKGATLSG